MPFITTQQEEIIPFLVNRAPLKIAPSLHKGLDLCRETAEYGQPDTHSEEPGACSLWKETEVRSRKTEFQGPTGSRWIYQQLRKPPKWQKAAHIHWNTGQECIFFFLVLVALSSSYKIWISSFYWKEENLIYLLVGQKSVPRYKQLLILIMY